MPYWLSLFAGLPARSYRPDAARAILDAARPEGCGLRAAGDDAQGRHLAAALRSSDRQQLTVASN